MPELSEKFYTDILMFHISKLAKYDENSDDYNDELKTIIKIIQCWKSIEELERKLTLKLRMFFDDYNIY